MSNEQRQTPALALIEVPAPLFRLLAQMAQDLLHPISNIANLAKTGASVSRGEGQADFLDAITREIDAVKRVATHLKAFATAPEVYPLDVSAAVASAIEYVGRSYKALGVELTCRDGQLPLMVYSDTMWMERALRHLLSHIARGTVPAGTVTVHTVVDDDVVVTATSSRLNEEGKSVNWWQFLAALAYNACATVTVNRRADGGATVCLAFSRAHDPVL